MFDFEGFRIRRSETDRVDEGEPVRWICDDNDFGEFEKRAMIDQIKRIAGSSPEISIFREI